ncbi:MAG TPA: CHAT domain-containing protein, partial [Thermodesulfovibrionia bacterium]|nr:CHAT domain-containing protein [Thermodesulfovibrionia bacterium]
SLKIIEPLAMEEKKIEVLDSMGVVLENATEYDRALEKFMGAADLSQTFSQDQWLAEQYINIGRIYDLRLSQYASARLFYEKALNIYERLGEPAKVAAMHLDIGRCYRLLGNFHEADNQYGQALKITENDDSEDMLRVRSKITIEQANNAWFQARYQDAMNLQAESYKLARQYKWPLEQVIALNTDGLIWWTLGDNDRALRKLDDALSLAKTLESRSDEVATTLNNIGIVYREMGQFDKSLESFEKAIEIDKKLKSRWAIAYDLRNKGLTLLRMGKAEESVSLFEEAVKEAQAIGNRINESKALLALGQAHAALGNITAAENDLNNALELARDMVLREVQWRCLFELAALKQSQGSQEGARQLLMDAVEVIEAMRADIKVLQLRDGFITNKLAVYETLVTLLINMGRPDEAFDVAERSRARNFIDLLGNQRLNLYGAVSQDLYNRYQTLKARIEENEMLLSQAKDEAEKTAYQGMLDKVKDDYQELMVEIMQKNPELASLVSVDPLKLGDVQTLLDPGAALVVYYVVPDQIFAWIITNRTSELVKIAANRDTLGEQVLKYRQMIQNLDPIEAQSRALYNLLITPVLPGIQGQKYVGIIPHNSLHHLSFATLSDGENYLVDHYPLFYLPSASVMRYTLEKRRDDKNVKVLAIGNPDLDEPALALPFAEREVDAIKWNFPEITILTGKDATESWVMEHIGEYGIIHLASHGEFDPVNPLFSAIKLKPDQNADGDFRAREVFSIKLNADLVVLSACQTGLGKITKGDEVIGLNRAFFYAGTHAIVSSLWRVSDVSTAVLIKQFYRSYTNQNKADSLRRAMLHVKNRYPHPGYWGAFTLVGDYY